MVESSIVCIYNVQQQECHAICHVDVCFVWYTVRSLWGPLFHFHNNFVLSTHWSHPCQYTNVFTLNIACLAGSCRRFWWKVCLGVILDFGRSPPLPFVVTLRRASAMQATLFNTVVLPLLWGCRLYTVQFAYSIYHILAICFVESKTNASPVSTTMYSLASEAKSWNKQWAWVELHELLWKS